MDSKLVAVIGGIVLFVLVAAVMTYWLIQQGLLATNSFLNQAPESQLLDAAISCSYWRCVSGCESPQTRDGDIFQCRSNFCNASWTDTGKSDGKICGDSAKAHPVTVNIPLSAGLSQVVSKNTISQTLSSKDNNQEFYISPTDSSCSDLGFGNVVYFDNRSVLLTSTLNTWPSNFVGGCDVNSQLAKTFGGADLCSQKIQINAGDYYVWTAPNRFGLALNTIVCTTSYQETQGVKGCGDVGGVCYPNSCPTGTHSMKGFCNQQNGANYACCSS